MCVWVRASQSLTIDRRTVEISLSLMMIGGLSQKTLNSKWPCNRHSTFLKAEFVEFFANIGLEDDGWADMENPPRQNVCPVRGGDLAGIRRFGYKFQLGPQTRISIDSMQTIGPGLPCANGFKALGPQSGDSSLLASTAH